MFANDHSWNGLRFPEIPSDNRADRGMICGAGTAVPCGRSACDHTPTALGGGEPMGALASSGDEEPFANWSYVENWLAYNWSVPVSGGGGCEVLRRRERPFLLFDDDGRVRPILSPKSLQRGQKFRLSARIL